MSNKNSSIKKMTKKNKRYTFHINPYFDTTLVDMNTLKEKGFPYEEERKRK